MPFRNTYGIVLKNVESFSQVDVTRSTFFAEKKRIVTAHFFQKTMSEQKGSQEAPWTGASTMVMSEHDALSTIISPNVSKKMDRLLTISLVFGVQLPNSESGH